MAFETKQDVILDAYSRLRISGLTVNPTPEDVTVGIERLESFMEMLEAKNLRLNYRFEEDPDPSTEHGVAKSHFNMMSTNLAVMLSDDFGKPIAPSLAGQARATLSNAYAITASENARQTPQSNRMPIGSGNRWWGRIQRYYPEADQADKYANKLVQGNSQDFEYDFSQYLVDGQTIDSFTIQVDTGLTVVSSTNNSTYISYRLMADSEAELGVKNGAITITYEGKDQTVFIQFEVLQKFTPN